jgi:hypothetical protein
MSITDIINRIDSKRWAESEPIFRDDCNWQYNYCQLRDKADTMGISLFEDDWDEDEVESDVDESVPLLDAWVQVCTWSVSKVGIEFIRHLESISSIDELKSAIKQAYDAGALNLTKFMVALLCKAEAENNTKDNDDNEEMTVMNTSREANNREVLCEMLEQAYDENRLVEASLEDAGNVYVLLDKEDNALVTLDKNSGEFLFTKAGKNKSNKRQYVSLPLPTNKSYMCANYTFRVVAEGLLSNKPEHVNRYKLFKEGREEYRRYTREDCKAQGVNFSEGWMGTLCDPTDINHINGNSLDNRDANLEVDTKAMNMAHARFMAEVHAYYPDLVSEELDCQGNKMHQWVDKIGVSCSQIRSWNDLNKNDVIKSFKDKKGEWTSRLTKEQIDRMLTYFGKLEK